MKLVCKWSCYIEHSIILWLHGIKSCSAAEFVFFSSPEMKAKVSFIDHEGPCPFPRGDNYEIVKIHWQNLKIHWTIFNQTWYKAYSFGEGDSILFQWRATPFWTSDNYEIAKKPLTKFNHLLLQNHWATSNPIWHKTSQ